MSAKTTYIDLVDQVAAKSAIPKAEARQVLDALAEVLADNLRGDVAVAFKDLGTFKPKLNKARQGRNPRTGETVQIDESHGVSFNASKSLKDALN